MAYLVALVPAGALGALVDAGVEELLVSLLPLQPAKTPSRPNSTVRVSNLFIVGVTFTKR